MKNFWGHASITGIYIGLGLSLCEVLAYLMSGWGGAAAINTILLVTATFGIAYWRCRQYSKPMEKFSFGNAFGYTLASMGFAGILYGATFFIMYNFVGMDYYNAQLSANLTAGGMPEDMINSLIAMYKQVMAHPLMVVFSMVISQLFQGVLVAPFVGILTRKSPKSLI